MESSQQNYNYNIDSEVVSLIIIIFINKTMSNHINTVTLKTATQKVPDKLNFYDTLMMKRYALPLYNDTIVTVDFLREVKKKRCYCPRLGLGLDLPCAHPPSAEVVKEEIIRLIEKKTKDKQFSAIEKGQYARLMDHLTTANHRAQKPWLLKIVASLDKGHAYFQMNYRPPKRVAGVIDAPLDIEVDNEDSFFNDIEKTHGKRVNRRLFVD